MIINGQLPIAMLYRANFRMLFLEGIFWFFVDIFLQSNFFFSKIKKLHCRYFFQLFICALLNDLFVAISSSEARRRGSTAAAAVRERFRSERVARELLEQIPFEKVRLACCGCYLLWLFVFAVCVTSERLSSASRLRLRLATMATIQCDGLPINATGLPTPPTSETATEKSTPIAGKRRSRFSRCLGFSFNWLTLRNVRKHVRIVFHALDVLFLDERVDGSFDNCDFRLERAQLRHGLRNQIRKLKIE